MSEKYLILYASLTGTTREISERLHDLLKQDLPEIDLSLSDVRDISPEQLTQYKKVLFGNSTWDHGIPSPDGEEFLERLIMDRPDLSSVTFAQFGIGDSAYPAFCGALPLIKQDLVTCKATVVDNDFLIDGFPGKDEMAKLVEWSKAFLDLK